MQGQGSALDPLEAGPPDLHDLGARAQARSALTQDGPGLAYCLTD
jgi:hypothetical protein